MSMDEEGIVPKYEVRKVYFEGDDFAESYPLDHPEDDLPKPTPDSYGVYENQTDGTQMHVEDYPTLAKAQAFVDAHAGETVRIVN